MSNLARANDNKAINHIQNMDQLIYPTQTPTGETANPARGGNNPRSKTVSPDSASVPWSAGAGNPKNNFTQVRDDTAAINRAPIGTEQVRAPFLDSINDQTATGNRTMAIGAGPSCGSPNATPTGTTQEMASTPAPATNTDMPMTGGDEAVKSPAAGPPSEQHPALPTENPKITIKLKDQIGGEVYFTIRPYTKMKKVIEKYCERVGVHRRTLRFMLEGVRLLDEHTAAELEMMDGDIIEVYPMQIGGRG